MAATIAERVAYLQALTVEVESLAIDGGMEQIHVARSAELAAGELALRDLRRQQRLA